MSPSEPRASTANGASTEEAASDLYRHSPATFARHREAVAAQLQASGDELGAARIRRLPVPTTAAWWINQLALRWPDELTALLDLGARLRAASEERNLARLTELDRTRRVRTDALLSLLWHHGAEEEPDDDTQTVDSTHRIHPTPEDLALVLETVTAAVLDDEVAELVRAGCLARTVEAPDLDLLRGAAGDGEESVPVTVPRRREAGQDVLAVATAAVVDAENRLAAATDTVASLTGMLDGLEQELAELTRDRDSTRARLETWRRTAVAAERELRVARARLGRLT